MLTYRRVVDDVHLSPAGIGHEAVPRGGCANGHLEVRRACPRPAQACLVGPPAGPTARASRAVATVLAWARLGRRVGQQAPRVGDARLQALLGADEVCVA